MLDDEEIFVGNVSRWRSREISRRLMNKNVLGSTKSPGGIKRVSSSGASQALKIIYGLFVSFTFFIITVHHIHENRMGPSTTIVVDTPRGKVAGAVRKTPSGLTYWSFLGMRYAQPPYGARRFRAPQLPPPEWYGIYDATKERDSCLSFDYLPHGVLIGDEDCLFINVHTREDFSLFGKLPVMVWIHGGAFYRGNGNLTLYGPDYLIEHRVVVVTFNYRLGPLGFLSTEDSISPGNYGLKDQVAALKWVRSNILSFGGDSDCVTIFGQDAGGASVGYHMLSPLSKGLFHRAIAISGSPLNPWAFNNNPRYSAMNLAQKLGRDSNNSQDIIDFLRNQAAKVIVTMAEETLPDELFQDWDNLFENVFIPSVEPDGESAFLIKEPWVILESNDVNYVPFMTGTVSAEGKNFLPEASEATNTISLTNLETELIALIPTPFQLSLKERQEFAARVKSFYFGNEFETNVNSLSLLNLFTDMLFLEGVDSMARMISANSKFPVFYYYFDYKSNCTLFGQELLSRLPGVAHGDDLQFLFRIADDLKTLSLSSQDARIKDTWVKLLADFAKTGNPTPASNTISVTWQPFSPRHEYFLLVNGSFVMQWGLHFSRMDFWQHNLFQ